MKISNTPAKYEALIKQYLRSTLDISLDIMIPEQKKVLVELCSCFSNTCC